MENNEKECSFDIGTIWAIEENGRIKQAWALADKDNGKGNWVEVGKFSDEKKDKDGR